MHTQHTGLNDQHRPVQPEGCRRHSLEPRPKALVGGRPELGSAISSTNQHGLTVRSHGEVMRCTPDFGLEWNKLRTVGGDRSSDRRRNNDRAARSSGEQRSAVTVLSFKSELNRRRLHLDLGLAFYCARGRRHRRR
jgi:hypothetical protein